MKLLEIPALPATTILLVEVGSTAHGTGLPGGEDHDELGVVVESPDQLVGLDNAGFRTVMHRTQPEGQPSGPGDIDRTLYSLRTFLRLAASGNPSILMTMWAPIEYATPYGHELRLMADMFVGRHVIPRYRGYMSSQAKKVMARRASAGRAELVARFGYDTKSAMHAARLGLQCIELLDTGRLQLPNAGPDGDWLRSVRRGDVAFGDWLERIDEVDAALASRVDDESIPPGPDRDRITQWSVETHRAVWSP